MTILRGFLIIGISTALCAIIGAATGWTLGVVAPSYYRTVFANPWRPNNPQTIDPVQLGLGLGLTQGLVAGLFVGCVVVLAVAWYNSRRVVVIPSESDREVRSGLPSIRSEAIRPSESSGM